MPRSWHNALTLCPIASCSTISRLQSVRLVSRTSQVCRLPIPINRAFHEPLTQYREKKGGTVLSEKTEPWTDLPGVGRSSTGDFVYKLDGLERNRAYEYRACVRHPLITTY